MRVRMKADVSGSRDGKAWPPRGAVLDVPDDEGVGLCTSGIAEPVADDEDADVETATPADDAEERALTTETAAALTPGAPEAEPKRAPAKKTAAKKTAAAPKTAS